MDNWIIKYGASIAGYAVVAKPVFGESSYSRRFMLSPTKSIVSARANDFTRNTQLLVNLASSINQLVLLYKKLLSLCSHTSKLSELFERLEQCAATQIKNEESHRTRGNSICFEHVNVISPNQNTIIKDLSFEVTQGNDLLIQGPSASGKTAIFRLLSGIWPLHSGSIMKPSHREIFYIPQHPYFPVGTLKEQIIYPMTQKQFNIDGLNEENLYKILEMVKLEYLQTKCGSDVITEWETVLSPSELQRLAVTRILFHQPR